MVAVAVAEREVTKPKGRTLDRWIAECHYSVVTIVPPGTVGTFRMDIVGRTKPPCQWNDRENPEKHKTHEAAIREAARHAVEAGHVGAMAVTVRRVYKPRELDREEIVTE